MTPDATAPVRSWSTLPDVEVRGLAALATALGLIESAKLSGFVMGGPDVNRERVDELLVYAEERGVSPSDDEVDEAVLAILAEVGCGALMGGGIARLLQASRIPAGYRVQPTDDVFSTLSTHCTPAGAARNAAQANARVLPSYLCTVRRRGRFRYDVVAMQQVLLPELSD